MEEAHSDRRRVTTGRQQKSQDTQVELRFRKELRATGLKAYRVQHRITLPKWGKRNQWTTPDVAFVSSKVAIYLDGCWWHGCTTCLQPTDKRTWIRKQAQARARDERHSRALVVLGWRVLRFWEHEDMKAAAQAVAAVIQTEAAAGVYGLPAGGN